LVKIPDVARCGTVAIEESEFLIPGQNLDFFPLFDFSVANIPGPREAKRPIWARIFVGLGVD
jgi:hypothetical protein